MICFILLGAYIQSKEEKKKKNDRTIQLKDLSVIIPFRNEQSRIDSILKSYLNSDKIPSEIIFINDHSMDNCADKIKKELQNLPIKIIDLKKDELGKKDAIQKGVLLAKNNFILTHDADIMFSNSYFSNLECLQQNDLIILPVKFCSKKIINIDVALANALNYSSSGLYRPIMASGANLLFKKQSYIKFAEIETHKHLLSGDDVFLLRSFINNKLTVSLKTNNKFQVETKSEETYNKIIKQRARWLSKVSNVGDRYALALAIIQMFINILYPALIIYGLFSLPMNYLIYFILIKVAIDQISLSLYFLRLKLYKEWLLLPLYSFFYPLYSIVILASLLNKKNYWKNRNIRQLIN